MSGRMSWSPPHGHSNDRTDQEDDRAQSEKGVARSGQGDQNKAEQGDGRSNDHQHCAHRPKISTLTAAVPDAQRTVSAAVGDTGMRRQPSEVIPERPR